MTGCKLKGLSTSKLPPLFTAFMHSIKLFWYKIGINLDKKLLVVEQKNKI